MNRSNELLRQSMANVHEQDDFDYAIKNFWDRFKFNPNPALLEEEPDLLAPSLADGGFADAFDVTCPSFLECGSNRSDGLIPICAWLTKFLGVIFKIW